MFTLRCVLLSTCLAGCASSHRPARWLSTAQLLTPGAEIRFEDGTGIVAGVPFKLLPAFANQRGSVCHGGESPSEVDAYLRGGALRVRVKVPQLEVPLYGALALCPVDADATGPGSRTYLIEVPERYVEATSEGRMSVVYESTMSGASKSQKNWVLFLSRSPF